MVQECAFLDEKYLDALIKRAHVHSLKDLAGLAPFLSSETLDVLVAEADIKGDISGIISLAPFLGSETLDALVDKAEEKGDIGEILMRASRYFSSRKGASPAIAFRSSFSPSS